jgi:hypothetical protein
METRRIVEMLGSFVLGGALVAVGYELARDRQGAPEPAQVALAPEDPGDLAAGETASGVVPQDALPAVDGMPYARGPDQSYVEMPPIYAPPVPFDEAAQARFPRHGLITGGAVMLRERPDLESDRLGLLRAGTRIRVDAERTFGGGCANGWHEVFPFGWLCIGAGIELAEQPPDDGLVAVADPDVDAPLPYDYWRVNHDATPLFHRLPSFEEQDRADAAGQAWLAKKGREPMPTDPKERPSDVPAVVKEYLNAAYYVTVAGEHVKSQRRFLRTNRGVYARKYQLGKKDGSEFRGVVLAGREELPIHWILREMPVMRREQPDSDVLVKTEEMLERRTRHRFERKLRIGDNDFWEDREGRLVFAFAVGVAEPIARPPGVDADEHWLHIDLSEQTLVAWIGDRPVFSTLVSTGKQPGMTPVGVHRLQSKFVATSMRDQPIEEEAYSIEDVPWTQYFAHNVALHGAFWHGGFGLVRSHGCVNLSPADARWLFGFTQPALPDGWHAVMPGVGGNGPGSAVVVTE